MNSSQDEASVKRLHTSFGLTYLVCRCVVGQCLRKLLLVLALDFLGALAAGRLESGTGDVGGSFRLAACLFGVDGFGVMNGEGNEDPSRSRGGVNEFAGSRVVAPGLVAQDKAVAGVLGTVAVERSSSAAG